MQVSCIQVSLIESNTSVVQNSMVLGSNPEIFFFSSLHFSITCFQTVPCCALLSLTLQVEVEVDAVDKGGNFIGWLSVEGKNLSVMLVEEGLCKVLPQAERLTFGKSLFDAEEKAREAKKNIWEVSQGDFFCTGMWLVKGR